MSKRFGVFLSLAALIALPLSAQNFGDVTGTISDATGSVIGGATVTVTNTATNQARTTTSNPTGNYAVPYLVPGVYDVRAESAGFKVTERKGVEVQVGAAARLDFKLEVGELTQRVQVEGGAPLLSTDSVAMGSVIATKQIVDLPLNGRDYLSLVSLSPNVSNEAPSTNSSSYQGGARSKVSLSVAGQRLEFNHYTLDGVENTDPNFNSYIIHPSVDFIQEFKAQTGVYSAEFGKGASQINVTTKSGTNELHGALFEFLRNSAVDAREWQAAGPKNPFRRNNYGFTIGGPVYIPKVFNGRNRLFFMTNWEQLRDRLTTQQVGAVANSSMRAGDFSGVTSVIYDPATRVLNSSGVPVSATPFPSNKIPSTRFNSVSLNIMKFYPDATVQGTLVRNYVTNSLAPNDSNQFNQRIDFVEGNKSNWFGRYSWGNDTATPAALFEANASVSKATVTQAVISNTRILSQSVVNEARFAWDQFNNDLVSVYANKRNVQAELGADGLVAPTPLAYGLASIGLTSGLSSFGGVTPWITRDSIFQWTDNVSVVKGRHSLKFGGEVRRDRYGQVGTLKATGEFDFDAQSTANPAAITSSGYVFADFLLGLPSQALRAVALGNGMLRRSAYSAYVQDDWKVSPKLTVNLGFRYENGRPWHDKYRGMINVQVFTLGVGPKGDSLIPNAQSPIITRPGDGAFYDGINLRYASGMPTQVGDQAMGRSLVNPNNRDFGPRVGLAYTPADHWSIRAGFGVFYVQDIGNAVFDLARNLGGRDGNVISFATRPQNTLNAPWASEAASPLCPGWAGACLVAPQIQTNYQGNRTPYVDQYLFNVQRELTQNIVVELGYLGNQGHHISRFVIFNQAIVKSGLTDSRSVADRRPFPAFGPIQEVLNVVNSNYNAVDAKLTQRFNKGLTYLLGFTWGKAIDNGSGVRTNSGDTLWPTNSYDLGQERGLSQFDVRRRMVASYVYELPFGKGKPLAGEGIAAAILGGWQLGGILTFADGTPLNGTQLGDTANLGNLGNQPNATGISPIPDSRSAQTFWNPAAFDYKSTDLTWRPGNLGRNTLFRPGTRSFDASLARTIKIHEAHNLNIRFEAFNAVNHPNWDAPNSDPRSASFGIITATRSNTTMRQLQFAMKYVF